MLSALYALALIGCGPPPCVAEGNAAGDCAPPLALPTSDGGEWDLADRRGEVVLVEFVTLWCGICQEMAPRIEAVRADYTDEGFEAVTVVVTDLSGAKPDAADAQTWADYFDLDHPVLYDPDQAAWGEWHFRNSVPLLFFVDREGAIRRRHAGGNSEEGLAAWVEEWL